ncbi:mandelate racemase/muconate lactonizing enzyme family protein [Acuticoccus sp.]|uniref:mandelate racemase/muconate lactonizing enzyme family protein n=1 Tax=Acuticoccus sp. TaxID=1904378 RepID=UPI003B51B438
MSVPITRLDAFAYRAPTPRPLATSFGVMRDRPAVFVRLEASDGAFGWGEVFANWPAAGAEHRVRLAAEDIADLVLGATPEAPSELFHALTRQTHIRALQCGEWGPFRQVIAGLDVAAHDLFARRAGVPLARMLDRGAVDRVPAYASGIAITDAVEAIPTARAAGYGAFKVKVGFATDRDVPLLADALSALGPDEVLFADANQAWDVASALDFLERTRGLPLGWLEEPIAADAPPADWGRVAGATAIPLAAGENLAGFETFEGAIASACLDVIQPDVAKWGGITGCIEVGRQAVAAGLSYCPHFLGGGLGLLASAHLLAAVRGGGILEVDANPNPLRDAFAPVAGGLVGGAMAIGDAPGLGVEALPEAIAPHLTLHATRTI